MRYTIAIAVLLLAGCVHRSDTARLYADVEQSVVYIGRASGVVVAPGLALTAAHVIATAPDNVVVVRDDANDLALVRLDTTGIVPARLASTPARIGDPVLVVGYPLGLAKQAVAGIIGAVGQDFAQRRGVYFVDASINKGHSGAPVFNAAGEVIGIAAAYVRGNEGVQRIGVAIPISKARPLLEGR